MLDREIAPVATPVSNLAPVRISSIRWMTALLVKSWLPEHRSCSEPIALAGYLLPRQVGVTLVGSIRILCLAPAEWLIVVPEPQVEMQSQPLPDLQQHGLSLTDWSNAFAVFVVEGSTVRTLLAKGCGLDLHPEEFPQGLCARTRFAQIPVIVQCLDNLRFELAAPRSYSYYLHEWLVDAAGAT